LRKSLAQVEQEKFRVKSGVASWPLMYFKCTFDICWVFTKFLVTDTQ